MAGLVLSLKPEEKFLVNGALVQNGPKAGQIRLPDIGVNVLRLTDCLHPDEIDTPVRRAYYQAQLILSGDAGPAADLKLMLALTGLDTVFKGTSAEELIGKTINDAGRSRYYSVLVTLKRVLPIEAQLMAIANPEPIKQTG